MFSGETNGVQEREPGGHMPSDSLRCDSRVIRPSLTRSEPGSGAGCADLDVEGSRGDHISLPSNKASPAEDGILRFPSRRVSIFRRGAICAFGKPFEDVSEFESPTIATGANIIRRVDVGMLQEALPHTNTAPRHVPGRVQAAGVAPSWQLRRSECNTALPHTQRNDLCHDEKKRQAYKDGKRATHDRPSMPRLPDHARHDDDYENILTDWTDEDLESFAEDCPFLAPSAIPLQSPANERLFSVNGRIFMYVPDSTGTYDLGESLEAGWRNYRRGRLGMWSSIARRVDPQTGKNMNDAAGLVASYSLLHLKKDDLDSVEGAVRIAEEKILNMGLGRIKDVALDGIRSLLRKQQLGGMHSMVFSLSDEGYVGIQEIHRENDKGDPPQPFWNDDKGYVGGQEIHRENDKGDPPQPFWNDDKGYVGGQEIHPQANDEKE